MTSLFTVAAPPPTWFEVNSVWAAWLGVGANLTLTLGTLALVWLAWRQGNDTAKNNNRMWERLTKRAQLALLPMTHEDHACIEATFRSPNSARQTPSLFFRLIVRAEETDASRVEIFADKLFRYEEGDWKPVRTWIPSHFCWVWNPAAGDVQHVQARIPRGAKRHCTLGFVVDPAVGSDSEYRINNEPEPQLCLTITNAGNNKNNILHPGKYKLRLEVASENADVSVWVLEFQLFNDWQPQPETAVQRMLEFKSPRPALEGR